MIVVTSRWTRRALTLTIVVSAAVYLLTRVGFWLQVAVVALFARVLFAAVDDGLRQSSRSW
jgi:hypothetical protein